MNIGDVVRRKDRELFDDRFITAVVESLPLNDGGFVLLKQARQQFVVLFNQLEVVVRAEELRQPAAQPPINAEDMVEIIEEAEDIAEEEIDHEEEWPLDEPPQEPGVQWVQVEPDIPDARVEFRQHPPRPNPFAGAIKKAKEEREGYEDIEF